MFLPVSHQIWPWQPPFVLLQIGAWCINWPVSTDMKSSRVASSICQEGQSERTFPILAFSSRFFLLFLIFLDFSSLFPDFFSLLPDFWQFFRCQGGHSAPWPLYWLRNWWKGADGSLTSEFGGWWKCYSCTAKLVRSSGNTCNKWLPVHPVLFLLRMSPRNSAPSTTSKGDWRKMMHHPTLMAT